MRKYQISIGARKGEPRVSMEVYAENAQRAGEQADCLALPFERVEVRPIAEDVSERVEAMRRVGAL